MKNVKIFGHVHFRLQYHLQFEGNDKKNRHFYQSLPRESQGQL